MSISSKKKVLIVSPIYPRYPDGSAAQTTIYHTILLLRKRYEVRIHCILSEEVIPVIPFDILNFVKITYYSLKKCGSSKSLKKIMTLWYSINKFQLIGDCIFNAVEEEIRLHIKQYQPDYILFEQPGFGMFHWRKKLAYSFEAKDFLRIHDAFPLHYKKLIANSKSFKESLLIRFEKSLILHYERKHIRDWDGILTHSDVDQIFYNELSRKSVPVHVAKIGIDLDYFSLPHISFDNRDIDMVYIGSMKWIPNVDCVVWFCEYVLPYILKQRSDFRLAIVGRNPSKRVKRLVSSNVLVTGEVEDIREYVMRSKLSFLFSFSGSGIKKKIMELLSMGIPIICDEVSLQGYKDVEMGGVINVNKNDVNGIVNRIVEVLGDKNQWFSLSKAAHTTARKYFDYRNIDYNFEEWLLK